MATVAVHVTTVQEDADKGLAFNFFFFFVYSNYTQYYFSTKCVCRKLHNMQTYDLINKIMNIAATIRAYNNIPIIIPIQVIIFLRLILCL